MISVERQQSPVALTSAHSIAGVLVAYSACILVSRLFFRLELWNLAMVWPAAGLAVFTLLRVRGRTYLVAIACLLMANVIVTLATGLPLLTSLVYAIANAVEAICAAGLLTRLRQRRAELVGVNDLVHLILASCAGAAVGGVIAIVCSPVPADPSRLVLFWHWSRNHALGILLTLFALLPWAAGTHSESRSHRRSECLEGIGFFIVLVVVLYIVYGRPLEPSQPLPYLVLPLLMWSACRLPLQYTTTGGLLLGIATIVGTQMGNGLFASLPYLPQTRIAAAQLFAVISLVSSTLVALVIADRERAEQKARKSEQSYRGLLEHASDAIFAVDCQGRVLSANSKACEMLSYEPSELLALNVRDILSPADAVSEPFAFEALSDGRTILQERNYRRKDGSVFVVENSAKRVADDLIQVIARDITERKSTEEALRRSEASFRSLVQNAPYGIGRSTSAGFFLAANPRLCEMLGYDSENELLVVDLKRELYADPLMHPALIAQCQREGHVNGVHVGWRRKDGKQITVRLSARCVPDQDQFDVVVEDISGQLELEAQLRQAQKLEALGSLAGGIAHDFNNVLMIIHSYSEMLCLNRVNDQVRAKAEKIINAASRGANLTRQLLAFSRRQVLRPSVLQLDTVVSDLCEMLKPVIGEDVCLQIHSSSNLWPVLADRGQLEQVILNLAINARDAMPSGGRLNISMRNVQLSPEFAETNKTVAGDYVELVVADTGCGMNAETQARIFDPFFTTKSVGKGTGLGLSTVYGIVKQSEGYVAVESREGAGTTFRIYLPRTSPFQKGRVDSFPDSIPSRGSANVLVVEDEEATREAVCSYLEQQGFSVASAGTAADAVALCSDAQPFPDLILSDVILPDRSGPELVQQLRNSHPELKVVLMSGYANDRIRPDRVTSTGFEYLQKPFQLSELVRTIRRLTGTHL